MKVEAPFIHLIKLHTKYYLYDVNSKMIVNISNDLFDFFKSNENIKAECIFRKNCASVPEERSAIPLQTEQSPAGLLVAIIYSTIPARKFKTICLGCHSA